MFKGVGDITDVGQRTAYIVVIEDDGRLYRQIPFVSSVNGDRSIVLAVVPTVGQTCSTGPVDSNKPRWCMYVLTSGGINWITLHDDSQFMLASPTE